MSAFNKDATSNFFFFLIDAHATGDFFKTFINMQLVIFFLCVLLVMSSVNFDVCSIAFVTYLLKGARFSIFVLILLITAPQSAWMDFLMLQLCCPFLLQ